MTTPLAHIPVLRAQVAAALALSPGETLVDCTFGRGGHTRDALARGAKVFGIDRDPDAIAVGRKMECEFPQQFQMLDGKFSDIEDLLRGAGISSVDAVLIDAGVSSPQLDDARRGFSFQHEGPLDARMSRDGLSAADIVNAWDEQDIADIIYRYGEEPKSRRIAKAIVYARASAPILRTTTLAEIVAKALGGRSGPKHPATRTFQALRIAVNGELEEMAAALAAAERLLVPGGRLVVISFHSLEDRIVKEFFAARSGKSVGHSRHVPVAAQAVRAATFTNISKAVRAAEAELAENPRARSAILRSAVRTDAQPREMN